MGNPFQPEQIKEKLRNNFEPISKDVSVNVGSKRTGGLKIEGLNQGGFYEDESQKQAIVEKLKDFLVGDEKLLLQAENLAHGRVVFTKKRAVVRFDEYVNAIRIFAARTKVVFGRKEKALKSVERRIYWDKADEENFNATTPELSLADAIGKYVSDNKVEGYDFEKSGNYTEQVYFYKEANDEFRLSWYYHVIHGAVNDAVIMDAVTGEVLWKGKASVMTDYVVKARAKGNWWDEYHATIDPSASPNVTNTAVTYLDFVLAVVGGSNYTRSSGSSGLAEFPPISSMNMVILDSELKNSQIKVYNDQATSYSETEQWILSGNITKEFTSSSSHDMETSLLVHMQTIAKFVYDNFSGYQWDSGSRMDGYANDNFTTGINGQANGTTWIRITTDNHYPGSVFHEYGHNIIYDVVGEWIGYDVSDYFEGAGMDEGFADYFSCTIRDDSHRYASNRELDNDYRYEDHYNLDSSPGGQYGLYNGKYNWEGHYGGQIIAGAVWELRGRGFTGSEVDDLFWETLNDLDGVTDTDRTFAKFAELMVGNADAGDKYALHTAFNAIHGITMPAGATPTIGSRAFSLQDGNDIVLWIDSNDNFIVVGDLVEDDTGSPSSGDFILRCSGTVAAWIDHANHNLHLKGKILAGETDFSAGTMAGSFIFKKNGTAVAYLKSSGDLHVKTYFVSNGSTP